MNKLTAFTLIELLVVIAIIGILSGLIIVTMSGVKDRANIAKSQIFSNSLRNALLANLITEWKLDETSGTAANDSWSGGNNGTLTNFSFDSTDGWRGPSQCVSAGCLQFDGVNDYIDSTISQIYTYTQPVSLEAWVYIPSSFTWTNGEVASFRATNYGMGIFRSATNNTLVFAARIGGASSYGAKDYAINRDTWYHLVFTGDGSVFDAYANGTKITTSSLNYGVLAGSDLNKIFRIGTNSIYGGSGGGYFAGYIDGVRIYNSTVPISKIKEDYCVGLNNLYAKGQITQEQYRSGILGIK